MRHSAVWSACQYPVYAVGSITTREYAMTAAHSKYLGAALALAIMVGGVAGCHKKDDTVDGAPGPAEQAGRRLDQVTDKAGRDLTKAADQANQQIQDAAKETREQVSKATGEASQELNKATD